MSIISRYSGYPMNTMGFGYGGYAPFGDFMDEPLLPYHYNAYADMAYPGYGGYWGNNWNSYNYPMYGGYGYNGLRNRYLRGGLRRSMSFW
jgi:hypothetical protein